MRRIQMQHRLLARGYLFDLLPQQASILHDRLVALAEMLIGGSTPARPIGAAVDLSAVPGAEGGAILGRTVAAFAETPSRYLLEVRHADAPAVKAALAAAGLPRAVIAVLNDSGALELSENLLEPLPVAELARAWSSPLDW